MEPFMSRVAVAAIIPIILMSGCEVAKPQGRTAPFASTVAQRLPTPVVAAPAPRPAQAAAVVVEDPGSTPGSLAADAAAYARAMERQLEQRGQGKVGKAQEVAGARV